MYTNAITFCSVRESNTCNAQCYYYSVTYIVIYCTTTLLQDYTLLYHCTATALLYNRTSASLVPCRALTHAASPLHYHYTLLYTKTLLRYSITLLHYPTTRLKQYSTIIQRCTTIRHYSTTAILDQYTTLNYCILQILVHVYTTTALLHRYTIALLYNTLLLSPTSDTTALLP